MADLSDAYQHQFITNQNASNLINSFFMMRVDAYPVWVASAHRVTGRAASIQ
ncbi:hypothetical protein [Paraburkholderia solisilvae]|uniref:hypothetical protein n=1 Tax=Paraburkholderia solisilvae TaxID=624376 RepID=UPI001581EAC3|nr:hypothetical protein [Paraburkholderia solisilvae]